MANDTSPLTTLDESDIDYSFDPLSEEYAFNIDNFNFPDHLQSEEDTNSGHGQLDSSVQVPDSVAVERSASHGRESSLPYSPPNLVHRSSSELSVSIAAPLSSTSSGRLQQWPGGLTSSSSSTVFWTPSRSGSESNLPNFATRPFATSTGYLFDEGNGDRTSSDLESLNALSQNDPTPETQDDNEWLDLLASTEEEPSGHTSVPADLPLDTIGRQTYLSLPTGDTQEWIPWCLPPVSSEQAPVETQNRQPAKRKRAEGDSLTREQTRKVRYAKACLRCRIYKEKCDLQSPCGRCMEVAMKIKLFRQPCQRLDLTEVIPFRTGNARFGQTESTFQKPDWSVEPHHTRTASVTYLFNDVDVALLPKLKLTCRRFIPKPTDVLFEHFAGPAGEIIVTPSPPFACINIEANKTREALEGYIKDITSFAIEEAIATSKEDIYCQGLSALHLSVHPILQKALQILACVYINFDTPIIVGGETLDVPLLKDMRAPIHGRYPIPSFLDFQLDTLCIHHMKTLMKAVSRGLKNIIFSKERHSRWYEIYLTVFVLLFSIEQVYLKQCSYLRGADLAENGANIFAQASPVTSYMLDLWRTSTKNLLYHYRCIMKATLPFSPSFKLEGEGYALLDAEAIRYIQNTANLVREREVELSGLRDFENTSMHALV